MVNSSNSRPEILWRQVWGLAALLVAIAFSWMAYGLYQPKILQKLGLAELMSRLLIVQGLLATIIEPFAGQLSDRIQQRLGNRLPIISIGIKLAGLIFVTISLLLAPNLVIEIPWLIPALMTVWVIAMMMFRSPAIALLTQFAPVTELPQASAVLVLVLAFCGAIEPVINIFLNKIGASISFLLGAIALIMGGYILQSLMPAHNLQPYTLNQDTPATTPRILLILIFVVGLGGGLEINLLMSLFPQELQTQLPSITLEFITSGILLVCAIAAIPLGEWTAQLSPNKAMLLGLGSLTGLMGLALLNDNDILVVGFILAFGVSVSLIFVSIIPFAFGKLPPSQAGLGIGLYCGGSAGGAVLVSILTQQVWLNSVAAFLLAEVAFFVVSGCIAISKKIQLA